MNQRGNDFLAEFKRAREAQVNSLAATVVTLRGRLEETLDVSCFKGARTSVPSENEWDAACRGGNPLLYSWAVLVVYRFARRPAVAAVYCHNDYGSFLSRMERSHHKRALRNGDVAFLPIGDDGKPYGDDGSLLRVPTEYQKRRDPIVREWTTTRARLGELRARGRLVSPRGVGLLRAERLLARKAMKVLGRTGEAHDALFARLTEECERDAVSA